MEELIGAEPKDLDDLRIEPLERALREVRDQVVERRSPALDAGGDFGGQRAVAIVAERFARARRSRSGDRRGRPRRPTGSRRRPARAGAIMDAGRSGRPARAMAGEKFARRHRSLAFGLKLEDLHDARRRPRRASSSPCAAMTMPRQRRASFRLDGAGAKQDEPAIAPRNVNACGHGCRPRIRLWMSTRRPRPVDDAVVLGQAAARRSPRASSCGFSCDGPCRQSIERRHEQAAPSCARSRSTSSLVSSGSIGRVDRGQHRAGIERLHHAHDRDAGFASPAMTARWTGAAPR